MTQILLGLQCIKLLIIMKYTMTFTHTVLLIIIHDILSISYVIELPSDIEPI